MSQKITDINLNTIKYMYCTFVESSKFLGFKSRSSLYQLKKKGILEPYIEFINEQKYLFMGAMME